MAGTPAATTMSAAVPAASRGRGDALSAGGCEDGKLLGQFGRATMRTGGAFPIAGADEDFAVALAFLAMKLVNRHWLKITGTAKISSGSQFTLHLARSSQREPAQN